MKNTLYQIRPKRILLTSLAFTLVAFLTSFGRNEEDLVLKNLSFASINPKDPEIKIRF